jgi:hypothetical protein
MADSNMHNSQRSRLHRHICTDTMHTLNGDKIPQDSVKFSI